MYTAKIENAGGEILTLTGVENKWQVFDITGLDPPRATVNLTDIAGLDGSRFNSSKLNTRNLVISLKINGDATANRLELYRFFRPKYGCTFFFKNARRDVKIQGYVESVECPQFTNLEVMQVSILCPFPYFRALAETIVDISNEIADFHFPFSINVGDPIPFSLYVDHREAVVFNDSEAETGAVITVDFLDAAGKIMIADVETGEQMTVSYSFQAGDRLVIDTNSGQKSIYLHRGRTKINLFSAMAAGSVFFSLLPGQNRFYYLADDGAADENVLITFAFSNLYVGV